MDPGLVERAQQGDREAFGLLAVPLGDRLFAVANRILRDDELAADATQQALVSIWRDLPQLRDRTRFDAWTYRLLVHACYAERRKERRWSPPLRVLPADASKDGADGTKLVIDRDQIERAARRLSIDHRAVVVLRFYLDLSVAEISALLDVPNGTVRSRLRYALRGLRAAIDSDAREKPKEALR
ncbi:MAG: sigma-70 family RNA polymerase sigma factor [Chloroflexota bacterium]|nr:sigma-70 family RNA polymerase sigma factor [Chloroflexota bacterium]